MCFSLKWMLAAVASVGFGCVALYNANQAWAAAATGITVIALLAAILGAIYSRPRAFYVGMCVFRWGFLFVNRIPQPLEFTNVLVEVARKPMLRRVEGGVLPHGAHPGYSRGPRGSYLYDMPIRQHFKTPVQSLLALIFAFTGGLVGQWFA